MWARFSEQLLRAAERFHRRTHPEPTLPKVELLATLWTEFEHFDRFAKDPRLSGIRINPAMILPDELEHALARINVPDATVPLWYDVKGRQLRIEEVHLCGNYYEIVMNHAISMELTCERSRGIILKAGNDEALIQEITDGGRRIVLADGALYGPRFRLVPGESVHIRNPTLRVHGPLFTDVELGKIETAKRAGFTRWFLSYVEDKRDIDQLRELIGQEPEIWLKIESKRGLEFVAHDFEKKDNLVLTAARGDLFVELDKPHQIANALRLIIKKDPGACVGSRILLSVVQRPMPPAEKERALKELYERAKWNTPQMAAVRDLLVAVFHDPVPSCADFSELAWLMDIGYRRFLLCDELCLHGDLLDTATGAFRAFTQDYSA